ncbi:hydroxymyristoyl-ACP dehydratase [uncultured Polaribacter sp.]|uniref:3-hydroxyacyl-ACP dehydratase FabZ family protein n=1 Tax=uncultured Polaribacter sp. TaxID=174711 RepID=UPI000ABC0278|nr:hydroxymyristoyl-ACP dehydratase [Polaribacter sp.]|tara:strand:- start:539 stop:979 length:441 start_codon:yes stop_codon:yes gene_type:complete
MNSEQIINNLPYAPPFLFVDALTEISENGVSGNYIFKEEAFFYKGHFKENPITPGVILTETMAQIGVVCLGIYLLQDEIVLKRKLQIALTSNQTDFYIPVLPNEKVTVISEKEYFRFNKLKCKVKMMNSKNELVCRGTISGMILTK